MRLKKIEVVGFKSFADREVIHVDDHVTGVIGPNGCGKSNIVDAVRWAMGEQSAKHLRGTGMQDVIFAGCATRGAAGVAEVTLTFSTEGGNVPPTYAEYPELGITRRLFADGTSEYLINKVPARLRDITELLLGTGAGTKGYSIIEQGQVGRLVSSKPEERRHVIDEAAGITRFKGQKAAAERRIDGTRQNLLRVQDIIAELEARLGTLKRQAQKAERYKRYRQELRDLDLWTASHKYLELSSTGGVLTDRREDLARQVDDLRRELETRESEIAARRVAVTDVERELSERQERVYGVDNRIKLIENENEYRVREQANLAKSVAQARAEVDVVERTLAAVEAELAEARGQRDALGDGTQAGGERRSVDQATDDHAAVIAQLDACATDLVAARDELATLRESSAAGNARAQTWGESVAELERRVSTIEADVETMRAAAAQDGAAIEKAAEVLTAAEARVAELRRSRAELDMRRKSLRDDVSQAEVELDTARGELQRCKSRLQSLQEIQSRYRRCASGVQVVMENRAELGGQMSTDGSVTSATSEQPVIGILADYISAPERLEAAVSAMLGDRLEGVVVDGVSAGVRGIELLKRVQEGRTAFLPRSVRAAPSPSRKSGWSDPAAGAAAKMEVVDLSGTAVAPRTAGDLPAGVMGRLVDLVDVDGEFADLVQVLVGDTVVVDGLPQALELWESGSVAETIVTTEGDRIEASGVVVGGSANALDSALLQQKREIRELEDIQRELAENLTQARSRHLARAQTLTEVELARERNEEELLAGEGERMTRATEVEQARERAAELTERATAITADRDRLREDLTRRRTELDALATELAEQAGRIPALERSAVALEARSTALRAERDRLADSLTDAKVALARWQQRADSLEGAVDRLARQVADETERRRRLEQQATEGNDRARILEQETEAATAEREGLLSQSREAAEQVSETRSRHDALRLEVDEIELSIRNLRAELDEQRERLQDVELGVQQNELERKHLDEDVLERLDVTLREVLVDFHHRAVAGKTERERQKELKRILSRMGEVNLTAIDEYDEVSQRYEYLTGQRDDLESAITQLQDAIDKINKTTRQRFKETFEQVNEQFQQVFPRLFNGGRAELRMTDPTDLLGTGVEIAAQPPGKQLRSLDLLSGGEKALTATSLIFAIFLIKPSPFCILDEVDAPLDDANVGRFCQLVRQLAEATQFVIITHNKITMETADRLFGVTMEQRGVSKLVSVNMRRAVELAYS